MSNTEDSINNLRRLTKELAEEIQYEEIGPLFKFCKLVCDNLKTFVLIIDSHGVIRYINQSCKKYLNDNNIQLQVGDLWFKVWDLDKEPKDFPISKSISTRSVINDTVISPKTGSKINITSIPLLFNGVSGVMCLVDLV